MPFNRYNQKYMKGKQGPATPKKTLPSLIHDTTLQKSYVLLQNMLLATINISSSHMFCNTYLGVAMLVKNSPEVARKTCPG